MPRRLHLTLFRLKAAALLLTGLCLPATPAAAQMSGQGSGGSMGRARGSQQQYPQQQQTIAPQNFPAPPPSTVDHLHGIVLSALDGKPVSRVLVSSNGNQGLAVLSDYQGRFAFDLRRALPPQNGTASPATLAASTLVLSFNLRRPGYVTRQLNISVPSYTPSEPEPDILLKITPAAVISGHVAMDSGHLPQFLNVQLRRKQINDGSAVYTPVNNVQPDPDGEFRFGELPPGDYKLSTMQATEAARPGIRRGPRNDQQPESVRGTRATFYPDADSLANASVLHLGPGEVVTADLPLRSTTFYRVTIPVTSTDAIAGVNATILPESGPMGMPYDPRQQAVRALLPDGTYTIRLNARAGSGPGLRRVNPNDAVVGTATVNPTTQQNLTASVTVHVAGGPVQTDPVALHPSSPIPVLVRRDFTETTNSSSQQPPSGVSPAQNLPQVMVSLVPVEAVNGFGGGASSTPDPTGEIYIRNAAEGSYHVRVNPMGANGYVASITSGGTDLLREPLVIGANGSNAPIEVTLRNDVASLKVDLDTGAPPTPPELSPGSQPAVATISAIPLDTSERQAVSIRQMLNPPSGLPGINSALAGGSFGNLAPGRYLVLAQQTQTFSLSQLEYRNTKVVEQLLSKGVTVTLTAGQKTEVRVPLLPAEDDQP